MIPILEIKERARIHGVPTSTIERDYVQSWLLKNLPLSFAALKGGTGIRKVYIEDYRFSDDLDFTLQEKINEDLLLELIKRAVIDTREETGIDFDENVDVLKTESGYRAIVYFTMLKKYGHTAVSIKVDLTTHENEQIISPLQDRRIIHPYSDDCVKVIKTYSMEEIMAEKVRSLFERTRPRDLYDVWSLSDTVDRGELLRILPDKCRLKNVAVDITSLKEKEPDFGGAWENSLRHQLKDVPEFTWVFRKVTEELADYIALSSGLRMSTEGT